MGAGLLGGASGMEEASAFSSAEFSVTGCGVGGVGKPRVTDSGELLSAAAARAVDENGRATITARS